jgi:hypothetical protein
VPVHTCACTPRSRSDTAVAHAHHPHALDDAHAARSVVVVAATTTQTHVRQHENTVAGMLQAPHPLHTLPKMVCLPSSHGVGASEMKNCAQAKPNT